MNPKKPSITQNKINVPTLPVNEGTTALIFTNEAVLTTRKSMYDTSVTTVVDTPKQKIMPKLIGISTATKVVTT